MQKFLLALIIGISLGAAGFFFATRPGSNEPRVDLSHAAVVTRMQELGRLETSSFTIEKVIEANASTGGAFRDFLFGDKLLLVAHGEVVAGFELAGLGEDDVRIDGTTIRVTLPAPTVFHARLDNERTRVYDRRSGIFARPDKDLEADARAAAERSIRAAACDANILDAASTNAAKQLKALFAAFGFADVTVAIPEAPPCS